MEKIKIKSMELSEYAADLVWDGRLRNLVSCIIEEKWYIDGSFKGGDLSENLLKDIARAFIERIKPDYGVNMAELIKKDVHLV